jgi:hypothetical protein
MSYYTKHWLGIAALVWLLWLAAAGQVVLGA